MNFLRYLDLMRFVGLFLFFVPALSFAGPTYPGKNSELLKHSDFYTKFYERFKVVDRHADLRPESKERGKEWVLVPHSADRVLHGYLLPPVSDEALYALDHELASIVERYFRPVFQENLGRVQVVVLDSEDLITAIYYHDGNLPDDGILEKLRARELREQTTSLLVLDRSVLSQVESLDELVAIIGHELFHYLRRKVTKQSLFDHMLTGMAEEELVDARSAQLLLEQGLNPIAMSRMLEKVLKLEHAKKEVRDSAQPTNRGMFGSHPPTEVRISRLNALIENWADRRSFPKFTAIPTAIGVVKSSPMPSQQTIWDQELRRIRLVTARNFPFFFQLDVLVGLSSLSSSWFLKEYDRFFAIDPKSAESIKRSFDPTTDWPGRHYYEGSPEFMRKVIEEYTDSILPIMDQELEKIFSKLTVENIETFARDHKISTEEVIQRIAQSFDNLYFSFTTYNNALERESRGSILRENYRYLVRSYVPLLNFFERWESRFSKFAGQFGIEFATRDLAIERAAKSLGNIRTRSDLAKWLEKLELFDAMKTIVPDRDGVSFRPPTYGLNRETKVVDEFIAGYIKVAPQLIRILNQENWDPLTIQMVRALKKKYFEALENLLFWSEITETKTRAIDAQIAAISLTPAEKMLLFDVFPLPTETHSISNLFRHSSISELLFLPNYKAAHEFWSGRVPGRGRFKEFAQELDKLFRFYAESANSYYGQDAFAKHLGMAEYRKWLIESMARYDYSLTDISLVLDHAPFWLSGRTYQATGIIEMVRDINKGINESIEDDLRFSRSIGGFFRSLILGGLGGAAIFLDFRKDAVDAYNRKKDFDRNVDERVTKRVEGTFYNRPEYKTDLIVAQEMQTFLFRQILRNGGLSSGLRNELELWKKFAVRGVTDFTDEWAERILDRAMYREAEVDVGVIRELFYSQLIWDLRIRDRLARVVWSAKHSELVKTARNQLENKNVRKAAMKAMADSIEKYFPEQSLEKVAVFNFIANEILTDHEETTWFRALSGLENTDRREELKNVEVTDGEAVGSRVITQIFEELHYAKMTDRLEALEFLLGNSDNVPLLFSNTEEGFRVAKEILFEKLGRRMPTDEDEYGRPVESREGKVRQLISKHLALSAVSTVLGPYRARRLFQSLDPKVRAVLIDPLLVGSKGLLADKIGRDWIIKVLVPKNASWKQLAIDLADGYVDALDKLGQSHLKTLFVGYLISTAAKTSKGKYHSLLYGIDEPRVHEHELEDAGLRDAGVILRRLFEANSALAKIGQRLHSSNVFPKAINDEIESIKDQAAPVGREEYYHWLQDAAKCDNVCKSIRLLDVKGSASVKVVMGAQISISEGSRKNVKRNAVLHLVRPNAVRRGETSFELVEHALRYALAKGHNELKVVIPMIERARTTFRQEIDLRQERKSMTEMSKIYSPEKEYGEGFRFITPDYISEVDPLIDESRAGAVNAIEVLRLSELSETQRKSVATAIIAKESEIHLNEQSGSSDDRQIFDKDRHEGQFLIVTDAALCKKYGVETGRLILTIDGGQVSSISVSKKKSVLEAVTFVGAVLLAAGDRDIIANGIVDWVLRDVLEDRSRAQDPAVRVAVRTLIERQLLDAQLKSERDPAKAMLSILAHLEADGYRVDGTIWDFLTAAGTSQTWDRYLAPGDPNSYGQKAFAKLMQIAECSELLTQAVKKAE